MASGFFDLLAFRVWKSQSNPDVVFSPISKTIGLNVTTLSSGLITTTLTSGLKTTTLSTKPED